MNDYKISRGKTLFFTCFVFLIFLCLLEISGRIVLALWYKTPSYLVYGFVSKPAFLPVSVAEPYTDYYKGKPNRSTKNPVNSMGLRGPAISPEKKEGLRILCLGASTTYGDNLKYRYTYPALLQAMLDQTHGKDTYTVINAGQPGFDLSHIISFVKHEAMLLEPDIVLVLSVNNNFKAPEFWFVQLDLHSGDDPKNNSRMQSGSNIYARAKRVFVRYSSIGRIFENIRLRGWYRYSAEFDWEAFANALVAKDNIWEAAYRRNLSTLIDLLLSINREVKIVLLEQAVNTAEFPALMGPWSRAGTILRETAALHQNVYTLDLLHPIAEAAEKGIPVWQDKELHDPLHLSKSGNEIIAGRILDFLKTLPR